MKKIKIISAHYADEFEKDLNDFVASHDDCITDIQFQVSGGATRTFAAMISYIEWTQ